MGKMLIKKTRVMHNVRYETSMSTYNIMNSSPQQAHPFSTIKMERASTHARHARHDHDHDSQNGRAGRGTGNTHDV